MRRVWRGFYEPLHTANFWKRLAALPESVQQLAHKNYALLSADSYHPSLHFKKVGKNKTLWSVRVGEH